MDYENNKDSVTKNNQTSQCVETGSYKLELKRTLEILQDLLVKMLRNAEIQYYSHQH